MSSRTNRELCMLAENFNIKKHRTAGMYLSTKLDGMRCLWLPHTQGLEVAKIPFANVEKDKREHIATGLWSRYGKIIHAPAEFTTGFPPYPLDGELYMGNGRFQELMGTVKELSPGREWDHVKFMVFDMPSYSQVFADGRINNPNFRKTMNLINNMAAIGMPSDVNRGSFDSSYGLMKKYLKETNFLKIHEQRLLPFYTAAAIQIIEEELERVTNEGGEGLMLRHPASEWEPIRSNYLLKIKKLHDADALVIGYRTGQGKYEGMLGSLTVRMGTTVFELSGFTDEERTLRSHWSSWAGHNPGVLCSECPLPFDDDPCPAFPLGSIITFRYRELTDDGIPKEARYLRKIL